MKDATGGKLTGERSEFFFLFQLKKNPCFFLPSDLTSRIFPPIPEPPPPPPTHTKNSKRNKTEDSWRKSHQWVGLTRKHAAATAGDVVVAEAFKKHCTNAPDPDLGGAWRSCFSDEHYFPTLLAIGGWDSETVRGVFCFFSPPLRGRKRERDGEREKQLTFVSFSLFLSRLFFFLLDETKKKKRQRRRQDCEGDMTHTVWCRGWHCVGDLKLHPKTYHLKDLSSASSSSKSGGGSGGGGDDSDNDGDKSSSSSSSKRSRKSSHSPSSPALDASKFLRSLRRAPPVSLDAEPGPRCEDDAAAVAAGRLLSPVGALVARARGGKVAPPPPSSRPSSSSSSSLSHSHRRHAAPSNPSEDPAALVGGRCSLFARKFKDDVRWRVGRGVVALAAEDELEAFPATS